MKVGRLATKNDTPKPPVTQGVNALAQIRKHIREGHRARDVVWSHVPIIRPGQTARSNENFDGVFEVLILHRAEGHMLSQLLGVVGGATTAENDQIIRDLNL